MTVEEDTHQCPIDRCVVRVPAHQLMCRKHWKLVPYNLGRALYSAWDNGKGAGTPEHQQAMKSAIAVVESRLAER